MADLIILDRDIFTIPPMEIARAQAVMTLRDGQIVYGLNMPVETRQPRITMELPGPKARAIIATDSRVASPSLPRVYPLVADHAEGCMVTDVDGNRFLDFAAGIAVCATGHCHPRVVTEEAASQVIPSSSPTLQSC